MNNFNITEIEQIINKSEFCRNDNDIPREIYGVIYSLGRDAESSEEYKYSYNLLINLCEHCNPHVRAYAILGLALLNAEENLFDKDKVQQVIYREWNSNVKYRFYISDAADDFNNKFGWNIELS
ncbi:MAG: hypothetical protein J6C19_05520 [Lachnospiraceae bacterium]|nr:hypothetical protein [Lachnospiraceae bacterium]MBO5144978.1 hypothetical protein [Lachnospiraceae bacterium]